MKRARGFLKNERGELREPEAQTVISMIISRF